MPRRGLQMQPMEHILITGATGLVGSAVPRHFAPTGQQRLYLATRESGPDPERFRFFDFEQLPATIDALAGIDTLFLLRPPAIADVPRYFGPLLAGAKRRGVSRIVFLSVQGAEQVSFIPHAKIERLIREEGFDYTFIRPSYFMQNLTTTLLPDLRDRRRIFLPAGRHPFLWVDVEDVGRAIARVLAEPERHAGRAYAITGAEHHTFGEVADLLSEALDETVTYSSPNLPRFSWEMRRRGHPWSYIGVMILLHYLARFQPPAPVTDDYHHLTRQAPRSLAAFIRERREAWRRPRA